MPAPLDAGPTTPAGAGRRSVRRPRSRAALLAVAILAASGAAVAATPALAAQPAASTVELQLLGINDFHGHLDPGRNPGDPSVAGKLGGVVNQLEAEVPDSLFVAAGDNIGASPFISSSQKDEPTIAALNAMGLDVSSVGNHEFDRGYADLANRVIPLASFPYLGANVNGEDPTLAPTTVLTTTSGIKVGFVGVVTEETASLVSPAGIQGITFTDPAVAINNAADALSDGDQGNGEADVVVVLSHEGAPVPATTPEACAAMAARDDAFGNIVSTADANVDAILGGHTHLAVNCALPKPGGGLRPVTEAVSYGTAMSRIRLSYDTQSKAVTATAPELIDLREASVTADPAIEQIVADAQAQADVIGREVIGSITTDIPRAKTAGGDEDRGSESLLGNFIADVQLDATRAPERGAAQIAFMNPGGLRADFDYDNIDAGESPGQVTYAEAAVVQPFANTLFTQKLTGAQIKQVLEEQYQPAGSSRPFLALGVSEGFRYELDGRKPSGQRISNMTLNGTPLDLSASYTVTANSFLASGGDNFTTLAQGTDRRDTGLDDLSVLVQYFRDNPGIVPDTTDRSILVAPLPGETPTPCTGPGTVSVSPSTIIATQAAGVAVTASPNSQVALYAYSRPSTDFFVARRALLSDTGTTQFTVVPPTNTRLYVQQAGCPDTPRSASRVLNVRPALSLSVTRNGRRTYTFRGDTLPALAGGRFVTLYRITPDGRQVIAAQTTARASDGEWVIRRTFSGTGRFGFTVRTGQTLVNAPGSSPVRSVRIF